eukprot:15338644-Ditylum_brightwellii.AAC.1
MLGERCSAQATIALPWCFQFNPTMDVDILRDDLCRVRSLKLLFFAKKGMIVVQCILIANGNR